MEVIFEVDWGKGSVYKDYAYDFIKKWTWWLTQLSVTKVLNSFPW